MKDERNILIITGTPDANKKVDGLLHEAGFNSFGSGDMRSFGFPDAHVRTIYAEDGNKVSCVGLDSDSDYSGCAMVVYLAAHLTAEIVATFPNAKEQPPSGPFEFEGRMFEVDGDEKRVVQADDFFVTNVCEVGNAEYIRWIVGCEGYERWILRPLVSEEKQTALDQLAQLEASASDLRETIDGMK